MIQIAMKSNGSMNRDSLLSMNRTHIQGTFSAQNITGLNRPPGAQMHPANTQATTCRPAQEVPYRPAQEAPRRPAQAAPATAPPARKLPAFQKPMQKGQKAPLHSSGTNPGILTACFGWNTLNAQCDIDVSAFLLGADNNVIGDSWFVFYGQPQSPDKSCQFKTGGDLDRETITIDFRKLHAGVKKIVFVLTINEAFAKKLHFGMVKDAYIRILDVQGSECASFQMSEYYSNVISMMIGEIYQYNGNWKFNAVGNGVAKDLAGLCALYGVEVID